MKIKRGERRRERSIVRGKEGKEKLSESGEKKGEEGER